MVRKRAGSISRISMANVSQIFKNIVRIVVDEKLPCQSRGRPRKLSFDRAFDHIFMVLRTGMQWSLVKSLDHSFHYQTIYKTWKKWVDRVHKDDGGVCPFLRNCSWKYATCSKGSSPWNALAISSLESVCLSNVLIM